MDTRNKIYDIIMGFKASGNYRQDKANIQSIAMEYSHLVSDAILYWSDCAAIGDWFEKMGRRYGLLREFRENAIC